MVSNRFNRRRANRGTPPVCATKPIAPITPPPYAATASLTIGVITPPSFVYIEWQIYVPILLTPYPIDYAFSVPPGTPEIPPGQIDNGWPGLNTTLLLPDVPGVYIYRLEFSLAGTTILRRWASVTLPAP